uniref:Uncharacterized protein n=1 Tax=Anguilla anguilla TaxID=7936 RepID=A0A0E9PI83_ANGAN
MACCGSYHIYVYIMFYSVKLCHQIKAGITFLFCKNIVSLLLLKTKEN